MIKNNCSKFYLTLIVLSMVIVLSGSLVAAEIKYPVKNETYMQVFYWEMNKGEYAENYPQEADLWQLLSDRSEVYYES